MGISISSRSHIFDMRIVCLMMSDIFLVSPLILCQCLLHSCFYLVGCEQLVVGPDESHCQLFSVGCLAVFRQYVVACSSVGFAHLSFYSVALYGTLKEFLWHAEHHFRLWLLCLVVAFVADDFVHHPQWMDRHELASSASKSFV